MATEIGSNTHRKSHLPLIPEVGSKTLFPKVRCCGISYSRLLLDDTALNAHQYCMGLVQSGVCECGHSIDDEYHYFFSCPKYNGIRDELPESVKEILTKSPKCEGSESLWLTTSLLLTPGSQDGISKRHSREILTATFDFITKIWTSSITILLLHISLSVRIMPLPWPEAFSHRISGVCFINTKKSTHFSVDFQRNFVLSVKIYKCILTHSGWYICQW